MARRAPGGQLHPHSVSVLTGAQKLLVPLDRTAKRTEAGAQAALDVCLGDQQAGPGDELGCLAQPEVGGTAAAMVDDDLANRVRPLLEVSERTGPDALSTIRTPTPLASRSHASVRPVGPAPTTSTSIRRLHSVSY